MKSLATVGSHPDKSISYKKYLVQSAKNTQRNSIQFEHEGRLSGKRKIKKNSKLQLSCLQPQNTEKVKILFGCKRSLG
jgi:hypothetical protein